MTTALVRMRLYAFCRSGRVVAPLITTVAIVGLLYGGGAQAPGDGYGFSAYILMPIIAWQTRTLLDTEPDVARRLVIVTVGRRRELIAGLIATVISALSTIGVALVLPWLFGGISVHPRPGDAPLSSGFVLGPWALLLIVPPAIALGALASRVVTRSVGAGAMVLIGGWVVIVVAGLPRSPVRWLVPPLIGITKAARATFDGGAILALTAWTLVWALLAGVAYVQVRRVRA